MDSRRDFLKKAFLSSGITVFPGTLYESIQRALAIEPNPGTSYVDAEHIVILMQENRSFDHMFGCLQGVRGFNDPRALRLSNGNSVFLQTNAAGETYAPWRLDIKDTRATWMGSLPHTRDSQVDAWNNGNHDNWIDAKRSHQEEYAQVPLTMGHYTREDLPFYYALADAFTVCDQNYCSVMSSTLPNRSVFWTGTVRDQQSTSSRVYMRNGDFTPSDLSWSTYPERLQKSGISWKIYQNDLLHSGGMTPEERTWLGNFICNILEFFRSYNVQLSPRYGERIQEEISDVTGQMQQLESQPGKTRALAERLRKLKEDYDLSQRAGLSQLPLSMQNLHNRAFVTNDSDPDFHVLETINFDDDGTTHHMQVPKGDIFHQFRKDVSTSKLPTISWLVAPEKFSDHPSSPWYGAWYVSEVMNILTKDPEVWKRTIFILTYDENDGYFDHAPSFVAADPNNKETGGASVGIETGVEYTYLRDELAQHVPDDEARSGPIGLGYRVPMIVASPWSRGGWVNSQLFDHTSTIQFLEEFVKRKFGKEVREANISAWRRSICGDLTSIFRPYEGKGPSLPFLDRNEFVESIQRARFEEIPSNYRALSAEEIEAINQEPRASKLFPSQEPGIRQACAIPYEAYADACLSVDRKSIEVQMRMGNDICGVGATGSPFNIYLYGTKGGIADVERKLSHKGMMAATYAVEAAATMRKSFDLSLFKDGRYNIAIHGPNGFFREFKGDSGDPFIKVECIYQLGNLSGGRRSGNVKLHVKRVDGNKDYKIEVIDNSYNATHITRVVSAGTVNISLGLEKQHGWYDFSVKAAGFDSFEKRYAGHVETGHPSWTDPLMGGVVQDA